MISSRAQRLLHHVDRAWGRRWFEARRRLGLAGEPRLVLFDGWAGAGGTVVRGRVLEPPTRVPAPPLPGPLRGLVRRVADLHARYAAVDVPGAAVEVRCGERVERTTTDYEGMFDVTLPGDGSPIASVRVLEEGLEGEARIFAPGPSATHVIVSDIDDTILDTELSDPLRRYAQLLTTELSTRLPFDGVGALYRALTADGTPIFYLSNSPWNLHEELRTLFEAHALPRGPLLLRDWGIRREGVVPGTRAGRLHKEEALRRIAEAFPTLPMILIGDTTRRDATHYLNVAERYPGRVAVIYLRRVEGRLAGRADLARLRERALGIGVDLLIADSTAALARDARTRGLVAAGAVDDVRAACADEVSRSEPLQELLNDV